MPADAAVRSTDTETDRVPQIETPANDDESKNDTEKTEEFMESVIEPNEIETINNESDWQKPISLKALKKKLNEIFVIK